MAIGHKLSGLKRTNWNNKSENQKKKILKKHFNELNIKETKYLEKGTKLSENQLKSSIERLTKEYTKKQNKEQIKKQKINLRNKQKGITNNSLISNKLKNTINSFNQKVDKFELQVKDKFGGMDILVDYLKGEHIKLSLRKKDFFRNNNVIEKESFDSLYPKTIKSMEQHIKRIEQQSNNLNLEKLIDETDSNNFINEFLETDVMEGNSKESILYLKNEFNKLNALQKEILIKGELGQLRETYKNKQKKDLTDINYTNAYNRTLNSIRTVYKETSGKSLI